jgi:hypothetical protein
MASGLSRAVVAERLGVSIKTVDRWTKDGKLKKLPDGGYDPDELDKFIDEAPLDEEDNPAQALQRALVAQTRATRDMQAFANRQLELLEK